MTESNGLSDGRERRPSRSALAKIAWILAGLSLLLTITDIFWMRFYLPAFVIGVVALVISALVSRRAGKRPFSRSARTLVSAIAAALPVLIVLTLLAAVALRPAFLPQPETLDVDLRVSVEGDFSLTYTGDVDVVDTEASDEFEASFTTRYDSMQLFVVIAPDNIGPNTISCEVSINGTVVVEKRTTEDRFLDCGADLQDLYDEQIDKR